MFNTVPPKELIEREGAFSQIPPWDDTVPLDKIMDKIPPAVRPQERVGETETAQSPVSKVTAWSERSKNQKCERCWNYFPSVGKDSKYPTLCSRCVGVIEAV